jgi:hypothetical protein
MPLKTDAFVLSQVQALLDRTVVLHRRKPKNERACQAIQILLVLLKVRRAARLECYAKDCKTWFKEIRAMLSTHFPHVELIDWSATTDEHEPLLVDMSHPPNPKYVRAIHDAYASETKLSDLDPRVSVPMGKLLGYMCAYDDKMDNGHLVSRWDSLGTIGLKTLLGGGFPMVIDMFGFGCSVSDTSKSTFWKHVRAIEKVRERANKVLAGKSLKLDKDTRIIIERFVVSTES